MTEEIETFVKLLSLGSSVVVIVAGTLHQLRSSSSVDWQKTASSLWEVLASLEAMRKSGELKSLNEATEKAVDMVKTIRGKKKLSKKVVHKIKEHVRLRFKDLE